MSTAVSRPRDVVLASVLTMVGSLLALMGIFTAQGELRSSRVRSEIETLLQDERLTPVDISVETLLNAVEVGLMAASAASVAAIVLAVFVLRRHNPSRIGLTVLGGIAALAVLLSGIPGLAIAIFVAYTTSLLWRQPVRSWFAQGSDDDVTGAQPDAGRDPGREPPHPPHPPLWGRPDAGGEHTGGSPEGGPPSPGQPGASEPSSPEQPGAYQQPGPYQQPWPPAPGQHSPGQSQPPHPQPAHPHQPQQPDPYQYPPAQGGYGTQAYPSAHAQGYGYGYGYPSAYYGYAPRHDPSRRPPQVVAAHVMTWIGAAFGLVAGIFFVAAASSQETVDLVMEQLAAPEADRDAFVLTLRIAGAVVALWSVAVVAVSVFSWRRSNWAAILLTVMGGGYLVMQLVTLVTGQLAVLFTIVWVAAVLVLLWWPASRQWYATARFDRPGGVGSYGGGPYPQPPGQYPGQYPGQSGQSGRPGQQPPKRNQPW